MMVSAQRRVEAVPPMNRVWERESVSARAIAAS